MIARPESVDALRAALERVEAAADGDSNDEEIEALNEALNWALERWPEVEVDIYTVSIEVSVSAASLDEAVTTALVEMANQAFEVILPDGTSTVVDGRLFRLRRDWELGLEQSDGDRHRATLAITMKRRLDEVMEDLDASDALYQSYDELLKRVVREGFRIDPDTGRPL